MAKILGDRFATISGADDSAYRFVEEIMRSAPAAGHPEDGDENESGAQQGQETDVEDKKLVLRLLMLLKDFDDKLLQEAIRIISA